MHILECYAENFGKLHKYRFMPNEGLNVICEGNGSGKTTLAAFIRAMFYGMPATRTKKLLDEAERKKYKPWQSGMWGGYLCFEIDGRSYRIERTFSDRDSQDTFRLLDLKTGLESFDYDKNIGQKLFKIDRQAFTSTVYITSSSMDVLLNASLNTKLGETPLIDDDTYDFEKTSAILKNMKKSLKAKLTQVQRDLDEIRCAYAEKNKEYKQLSELLNSENTEHLDNEITGFKFPQAMVNTMFLFVFLVVMCIMICLEFKTYKIFITALVFMLIEMLLQSYIYVKKKDNNQRITEAQIIKNRKQYIDNIYITKKDNLEKEIMEFQNKINIYSRKSEELLEKFNLIKDTQECIEEAYDEMISGHLHGVRKYLKKYMSMFDSQLSEHLTIDVDFRAGVDESGIVRDIDYYSNGYKDIIRICQRFALIEAVFGEDTPFIILDDPFINLDDEMLGRAKNALNRLSEHIQIIYFTCSWTRCPEID